MKEAKNKIILNGKWYRWNDFYAVAEKLFAETGSINVSVKFLYNDLPIGRWLSRQRNRKQKGQLKDWQIVKLESLNFLWSQTELCKEKKKSEWFDKFELAKNYYKEHGDLFIPRSYIVDGFFLGCWIGNQRGRYSGYGNVPLNENQIRLLESIGMVWNTLTDKWEKKYKIAKQYYNEFGTLRMRTETVYHGLRLGKWLCLQRVQRKTAKNYSEERIEKLNNIGMIWNTKKDIH